MKFIRMPNIFGTDMWGEIYGGYQWVISYDPQEDGYRASYKSVNHVDKMAIHLDGAPFQSFTKAEEACKLAYKQLRQPN